MCIAVSASACDKTSAIIVEVTTDSTGPRIDRLSFAVGSRLVGDANFAPIVRDPTASVAIDVTGRDLIADPYRLYVENGLGDGGGPLEVVVLGYTTGTDAPTAFALAGPQDFVPRETILLRVTLMPRANVNPLPTGCIWWTQNGQRMWIGSPDDHDCDGFSPPQDCDDENYRVNPAATERCNNNIDDNCNGQTDEASDEDHDGYTTCDGDCNDHDPAIHPGAVEVCDGKDNDCNGQCDDGFDLDGDGITTCGTVILADGTCGGQDRPDCNDNDADIHPGAVEVCDGKDNDCNGLCDDVSDFDADHDGFTTCGTLVGVVPQKGICGAPVPRLVDCVDDDATIHPYAHEICDGKDDSCDGVRETSEPCFVGEGTSCGVGERVCMDFGGDAGVGGLDPTCTPSTDLSFPVDPALCTAYRLDCASDVEPWPCAAKRAALDRLSCDLAYKLTAGSATQPPQLSLCPNARAPLPAIPDATACVWTIAGGTLQEQYGVALDDGVTPPGGNITACQGSFVVQGARNPVAGPADVVLFYGDATHLQRAAVVYSLAPMLVASCPASGLTCKMGQ